ncbi:hypothetical protein ACFQZC_32875 [Streptacidiphilus monticola]
MPRRPRNLALAGALAALALITAPTAGKAAPAPRPSYCRRPPRS